jgi:hypothetical protein
VLRCDQLTFADGVNHPAAAQERIERNLSYRRRATTVVERRIGMRAEMR